PLRLLLLSRPSPPPVPATLPLPTLFRSQGPAVGVSLEGGRLGQHHDALDEPPDLDEGIEDEAAEHAHEDLDQADLRVAQEEAVHPETAEEDPEQADDEAALGLALRSGASGGLSVGALAVRGGASGGRAIGVRRRGAGACCG